MLPMLATVGAWLLLEWLLPSGGLRRWPLGPTADSAKLTHTLCSCSLPLLQSPSHLLAGNAGHEGGSQGGASLLFPLPGLYSCTDLVTRFLSSLTPHFQKRVPEVPSTPGGGGGHPAQDYPDFPQGLLP